VLQRTDDQLGFGYLKLATFTVATVPTASNNPRVLIYVSNEAGGATVAFFGRDELAQGAGSRCHLLVCPPFNLCYSNSAPLFSGGGRRPPKLSDKAFETV
jgi:hypothetical protein